MHNLSADVSTFMSVDINLKQNNYPHKILFIGRFAKEKGLSFLLDAWKSVSDRKEWSIT